ncbi:hypothetical protein A2924_00220 [Candidatus Giovannonibacteria bacterium RIFCSPLOWO2_01_FULL_44_16]|uniref:Uncharacterized protein n=1 Tax=Candidatus Giovannonibacteria bacterium RIFCSPLOWO2_01_FULL_44_16 TaxID=1798348 RepID=A0A1F5X290_9BACT|nr:MAG: hypothetical protein A2924_00220 [Candidatus Giovannonibacteria bacterium RIFCSPLOWO2_01_FULL_44_16]
MKKFLLFSGLLFFLGFSASSQAHFTGKGHVHETAKKVQFFLNKDCAKNDTCSLKRLTLIVKNYEVGFADDPYPSYGNASVVEYETDSVESLEKYAVVQFIMGGVFYSSKNANGKIEKNIGTVVGSFGENVQFFFQEWVIDSYDLDPVYNSNPDDGRFYYLRWNKVPGSYESRTRQYYGAEKPNSPIVYLTDYPSGAFVTGPGAVNAAMKFKTCLYKAGDVPAKTVRSDINFAKPIACFEWQNIYMFDFDTGKFKTDKVDIPALFKELNHN